MSDLNKEIEKLIKEEKTKAEIKGYLAYKGVKGKDLKAIIEKYDLKGASRSGSLGDTLQFIEEKPRTENELYAYIIESGTKNEARWISQRNTIRLVAVSIYKKCGTKFEDKEATDSQKAKVKEIVAA